MSILVNEKTKVIVQGITGNAGAFHTSQMINYGTNIVAGVTPGKDGQLFDKKIPIYDSVLDARKNTNGNASIIYVPAPFAADSIIEAIFAGIELIVCITEGIPVIDMIRVKNALRQTSAILIGPNCPGIITPDECKMGIMPASIHKKGKVGVVSRSGTLTYEAVSQLTDLGIGQSTCIGIGGDPVCGMNFIDVLSRFNDDSDTEAIVMIGEIGGNAEELAADYIKKYIKKPIAGFIAGKTAPKGRRMGHAGAVISGGTGAAADKILALESAGVIVAENPSEIGLALKKVYLGK